MSKTLCATHQGWLEIPDALVPGFVQEDKAQIISETDGFTLRAPASFAPLDDSDREAIRSAAAEGAPPAAEGGSEAAPLEPAPSDPPTDDAETKAVEPVAGPGDGATGGAYETRVLEPGKTAHRGRRKG